MKQYINNEYNTRILVFYPRLLDQSKTMFIHTKYIPDSLRTILAIMVCLVEFRESSLNECRRYDHCSRAECS